MKVRALPVIAATLLIGCGAPGDRVVSANQTVSDTPSNAIYEDSSTRFVAAIVEGQLYLGDLADQDTYSDIPEVIGLQARLVNESTSEIRCLSAERIVFAIPRTPRAGMQYRCNGLVFRVERCSDDRNCNTYEVSATCRYFRRGRCYDQGPAEAVADWSYRFRGSRQEGITDINLDPASTSRYMTLRAGQGIFGSSAPN